MVAHAVTGLAPPTSAGRFIGSAPRKQHGLWWSGSTSWLLPASRALPTASACYCLDGRSAQERSAPLYQNCGEAPASSSNRLCSSPGTAIFAPPTACGSPPPAPAPGLGAPFPYRSWSAGSAWSPNSSGPAGHCACSRLLGSTPRAPGLRWPPVSSSPATHPVSNGRPNGSGRHRTGRISHTLRHLEATGHAPAVLSVLAALADRLDTYGSPIDYQRRRELFGTPCFDVLSQANWQQLCDQVGIRVGARNYRHAQRYLIEDLTGQSPVSFLPPLRLETADVAASYHTFCATMRAGLASLLRDHAAELFRKARHCRTDLLGTPLPLGPGPLGAGPSRASYLDADDLSDLLINQRLS